MSGAALNPGRDVQPGPGPCLAGDVEAPQILALTGADREVIQALLRQAASDFLTAGHRVIGVVEEIEPGGVQVALRDLASGAAYPLTQDLGPGSAGCSLDPAGLAAACGGVETAIAACIADGTSEATIVILSKFGRQEAEGRGLTHAFHAAVAADLPILTSVSPVVSAAWERFAGDLARLSAVDAAAVRAWLAALGSSRRPDLRLDAPLGTGLD